MNNDYIIEGRSAQTLNNIHGSARWMNIADVTAAGLLNDDGGVLLGQTSQGQLIRFNSDGHIIVFAPTGSGKGIGFVQPNLVDYRGSMVVLDPKGENAIVSAEHRRKMGQQVIILDPFRKTGMTGQTYNPLGALSFASKESIGPIIENLADALIPVSEGGAKVDSHWPLGAKKFASLLMWWMIAHEPPERRNLITLFQIAHGGYAMTKKRAEVLQKGLHPDPDIAMLCTAMGTWFSGRETKEFSYFESQLTNNLGWIGDFVWKDVLAGPPSPALNLKDRSKPVTVYLVLPFDQIDRYRPWLRIMVADLLNCIYAMPGGLNIPVLFMLDEAFAGLGHMDKLFTAAAAVRSAGARLVFIYQDIEQIEKAYGKSWASLVNNAGATLFWSVAPLDVRGQEFISKACGHRTVSVPGQPAGIGQLLIRPEQVPQLPKDEIIGFLRNQPPARFGRLDVLSNARFKSKLARNTTYDRAVAPVRSTTIARDWVPVDLEAIDAEPKRSASLNREADQTETALLNSLSQMFDERVIKHANGRYGYYDANGTFVPVDAG